MSAPVERRRSKRYATELRGWIGPAGGNQVACVIRDYCSGGFLVQLLQSAADQQFKPEVGLAIYLNTEFLAEKGSRPIRIRASVAWAKGEHLGLSFFRPSEAIVEALQAHDALARSGRDEPVTSSSGGTARCLAKFRHIAKGTLPVLYRDLLVTTLDGLLKRADHLGSNKELQQVYADINALEQLRSGEQLTQATIEAALDKPPVKDKAPPDKPGELSLVETDEFERWLEASRVASLLDRIFNDRIAALGSRLAGIRDVSGDCGLVVPFEPRHFTETLKSFAIKLELGPISRGHLFDTAARMLPDELGEFYHELDQALDDIGAPKAKVVPLQTNKAKRGVRAPVEATSGGGAAPTVGGNDTAPTAPTLKLSSNVVQRPFGRPQVLDSSAVAALRHRDEQNRQHLAHEMLNYVTALPHVGEVLSDSLRQLGGALTREAVADEDFFRNPEHPIRRIMDSLGHWQMFRPSDDPTAANDPAWHEIAALLAPVGHQDLDDEALRGIADQVAGLTKEQSRQYQRNVERVVEASEGRDRVRRARRMVSNELDRRYRDKQVPQVVVELLDVGWRAILELAWLNANDGADRYAEMLHLLDQVVRKLGGDFFDQQAGELDTPQVLTRIDDELMAVAFDPYSRNAVQSRLKSELEAAPTGDVELVAMPAPGESEDVRAVTARPEGVAETVWTAILDRCAKIRVGDRILMLDAPRGERAQRVAWIRGDRELFVLVDHRGVRARDLSLKDLAYGVYQHRVELDAVDGRPLSDRAVDAMLGRMEEQLAHQATHDSLTGLLGRQQFNMVLEKAISIPQRADNAGVLLLIDVNQFRLINEIHGYDTGDRLLVAVARQLEKLKSSKVLAHMGGDRFAALLPDIALSDGTEVARGIRTMVEEMPFDWQGGGMSTVVSVGVAALPMSDAGEAAHAGAVLQCAESALSLAKASGSDGVYVYNAEDPDIARRKESVQWVVKVDDALDRGHLKLRCQPIVPVRSDAGLTPHYEVLLGVDNGADEPLSIAEFIEAAERYQRMRSIDRWVTRTVMDWVATHRDHMPRLHGFAVNLSGQTASDPGFVQFVRDEFKRTGIEPKWLSFEVTETSAVSDLQASAGIIHDLKSLGCQVALDDFGSGLASYSYLKELPVDWLKIDGVFVRKIASSRDDFGVVKSINEIGHFLGKKTIAEYVADDEILQLVGEIGVDFAQGFGISPPMLMDDLMRSELATEEA